MSRVVKKNKNMHTLFYRLKELGGKRIAFSILVLAYLGWLTTINALMFLPVLGILPDNALSAMKHFGDFMSTGDTHNLIHELVFAFIIGPAGIGLLSQLWRPKENYAGQWVAMIVWGTMILTALITGNWVPQPLFITFGGLTLIATIFHPAGSGLFSWFSMSRVSKTLLALVVVASIPLLSFAVANINEQRAGAMSPSDSRGIFNFFGHQIPQHGGNSATEPMDTMNMEGQAGHNMKHIEVGHYRSMAAYGLIVILVGLLASARPGGWRFAAWIAGLLAVLLGSLSFMLPSAESSLGIAWGVAFAVWGTVFIAAAELTRKSSYSMEQPN